jgi:hypothetical protein
LLLFNITLQFKRVSSQSNLRMHFLFPRCVTYSLRIAHSFVPFSCQCTNSKAGRYENVQFPWLSALDTSELSLVYTLVSTQQLPFRQFPRWNVFWWWWAWNKKTTQFCVQCSTQWAERGRWGYMSLGVERPRPGCTNRIFVFPKWHHAPAPQDPAASFPAVYILNRELNLCWCPRTYRACAELLHERKYNMDRLIYSFRPWKI